MRHVRLRASLFVCGFLIYGFGRSAATAQTPDPLTIVEHAIAEAERSLHDGELQMAESRYRTVLEQGWMVIGALAAADRRFDAAIDAFGRASTSTADAGDALRALAIVHVQHGEPEDAIAILSELAVRRRNDTATRRLLAQALAAAGRPQEAVQQLEEARGTASGDVELAFALASGYLQLRKFDAAAHLFAEVATARPMPQTDVLIGRTYRDAGEYARAREWFESALAKDPRVPHAHYYLGTLAVRPDGVLELDAAIAEFTRELALAPNDPIVNLRLGMALVETHRDAEASRPLDIAARSPSAPAVAHYYRGRNQLGLADAAGAVVSFRRALALAGESGATSAQIGSIHYQLALALRDSGAGDEAARHFAEAERTAVARSDTERQRLARYLTDAPDPAAAAASIAAAIALPAELQFGGRTVAERDDARRRVMPALARANLNLGVMHAQAGRFLRAAEFCEEAAKIDPAFPQLQYSLGVAYFNAHRYDKAVAPLTRALAADPANPILPRMLATASLETDDYGTAVSLLANDSQRERDPSLQYAYGLALVGSGRAAEAEAIFTRLLTNHATTPELSVVLGHAYAQQGNYDAAIEALRRALQLKADVADANSALGLIFLKQGKLAESEAALRAELTAHPANAKARERLATVLDLLGRSDEAAIELRNVLGAKPDFADARYLLGKILLVRGSADEAAAHLEAAARLAPDDANVHYQLARAYQKLGRGELAEKEFAIYQGLKDKQRGKTP
jgi:tetratricopeptide (TPR) repeat protein